MGKKFIMKNDKGITLVMLVITMVLLAIVMSILVSASSHNSLLRFKDNTEREFNDIITNTDEKINSIRDQWGDIL